MLEKRYQVLKRLPPWKGAYYYQKSEVLYQLTYTFCKRFLPAYGNRTVDQMVQAARSGKQNIIEGCEAGETSSETHIKLLNVARASLQELREDFRDFLVSRQLTIWTAQNPRYDKMLAFCRQHNRLEDYEPFFEKWSAEEMANTGLTLCHITDKMLSSVLEKLENRFVTEGGIKERMHAARTGYRQAEMEELKRLREENQRLRALLKAHGIEP
ncbi:MAG: four helix bundle suffix domain-containing protein [Bacteroidaceae bacterium]|nr:four helix bundle suffix domain-containing protein [Bacteroidaceae bacterium]